MEIQIKALNNHINHMSQNFMCGNSPRNPKKSTTSSSSKKGTLKNNTTHRKKNNRSKNSSSALLKKKQIPINSFISPEFLDSNISERRNTKKAQKIRKYKKFLKYNDTTAAILGIIGLLFAVMEYEIFFENKDKPNYSSTSDSVIYRALVSITTGVVLVLLISHSFIAYKLGLEKGTNDSDISYFFSRNFKQLILELFIIGIHCPPSLDFTFEVQELDYSVVYSIPGCLMCWMLLRFYLVFRLFAQYSKWTNELAEECCEPEGCEANTIFAMKAVLKEKPFTTLMILMTISALIFGLAVRHFERPYWLKNPGLDPRVRQDYDSIWNGMWLILITMMTVGYGDFYPHTHMGRFVCILACFWGVFLVSMMVVTLTVVSSFDQKQKRAYDILYRLNIKEEIKKKSSFVIQLMMKWLVLSKRYERKLITKEEYYKEKIKLLGKLDMRLQYFRDLNSQIQEYEITSEESLRQLTEKIDRDLDEVKLILESLSTIEKQLAEIEQSQKVVVLALNECLVYTNTLENFVNSYIETGRSEDANIKISSSNYFDIKDIEKSENDDSNKKLPGLINFD